MLVLCCAGGERGKWTQQDQEKSTLAEMKTSICIWDYFQVCTIQMGRKRGEVNKLVNVSKGVSDKRFKKKKN